MPFKYINGARIWYEESGYDMDTLCEDGARLKIIPGAGHSSSIEQPEAVTRAIEDFLLR